MHLHARRTTARRLAVGGTNAEPQAPTHSLHSTLPPPLPLPPSSTPLHSSTPNAQTAPLESATERRDESQAYLTPLPPSYSPRSDHVWCGVVETR
jgi:hypothetical protein